MRQYVYTNCKHTHTSTFWVVETPILEMYRIINRFRFTFSVGQLAPSTGGQAPYTLNTARNLKRLHFDTRITSLDTIRKDRSIRTTTYISSYNLVVIIPLTIFEKNTYQLKICGLQPYNWIFAITSSITSVLSQSRSVLVFSDTPKALFFCQRRIHFRSIPHVYATFNFQAQSLDWGGKSWRIYHSSWSSQTNQ